MALRRHELSNEEWERIRHHFENSRGRPPVCDLRERVNAVLWILATGAPWRDLPERFGSWKTVYTSFSRWTKRGVWKAVVSDLLLELDGDGYIDHSLWSIDGTTSKAHRVAACGRKGG